MIFSYLLFSLVLMIIYLHYRDISFATFKVMSFFAGVATGFWALFVTNAAEQFGTNLRSTVTNTVPNFVRGAVVPITFSFKYLTTQFAGPETSLPNQGAVNQGTHRWHLLHPAGHGFVVVYVKETFREDLNYHEQQKLFLFVRRANN
ncbi:MAG: hypothetical protein U0T81_16355 [Saprospiraceae bacterium]